MKSTMNLPRRTLAAGQVRALLAGLLTITTGWAGAGLAQVNKPPIDAGVATQRGCRTGGFKELNRIAPEWVSVEASDAPQVAEGVVRESGVATGDNPAFHVSHDWDADVKLDDATNFLNSTGNKVVDGEQRMGIEWETAFFPPRFWPAPGDQAWIFGRWIFDCGHPPYQSEIHPPKATAFTRAEPIIFPGDERPLPSNLTYVFIHGRGGYYKSPVVGRSYDFDVPLPPRPAQPSTLRTAILSLPFGGPSPVVSQVPNSNPPKLHVTYPLAGVSDPTNTARFGAVIAAAWQPAAADPNEQTYRQLRVTFDSITINNDHDPIASGEWRLWLRAGGEWFEVGGLGDVDGGDTKAINRSVELIVPDNGELEIQSSGWEDDCDGRFRRRDADIKLWQVSLADAQCEVAGNDSIGILERNHTKADGFGIGSHNESSARNGDADTQNDFTLHYRVGLVKQWSVPPPPSTQLQVNLRGGVSGFRKARVTGPNGFDTGFFTFHDPFVNLTPGQYTIVGNTFTVGRGTPDCNTYHPEVVGSPQTLTAGQSGEATVNFVPVSCAPEP